MDVRGRRQLYGVLWLVMLAVALMAYVDPELITFAFFGSLALMLVTLRSARVTKREDCTMPIAYRGAMAILLAVALFGVVLGLVPGARDTSQVLGILFGVVAILAYRALVSRGPRAAIAAVAITMVVWLPFGFLALFGCHHHRAVPWTTIASLRCLGVILLLLPVSAAVTLFSFAPRNGELPDARLLR